MIDRIERIIRRTKRKLKSSTWYVNLQRLAHSKDNPKQPGLVMLQIDGLSRKQMEIAMKKGHLPFLKHLLEKQHYQVYSHYVGLPTTTPAVQGRLFYGKDMAVPAFSYYDRELKRIVTMFQTEDAKEIERRLEKDSNPLLRGGSGYSNIYTGGADESHFCLSNLGFNLMPKHPLSFLLLLILNIPSLFRVAALLIVETFLAAYDFVTGIFNRRHVWHELKFIPIRVGICVLLRELIAIGVMMDTHRGLPVIHANILSFDEQAHRRGPTSLFAHWSLKGVDSAIRRIYKAAHDSPNREYIVWVYSDHGQEDTNSYYKLLKKDLNQEILNVLNKRMNHSNDKHRHHEQESVLYKRIRLLGFDSLTRLYESQVESSDSASLPIVCAAGPLGHIYLQDENVSIEEKQHIARDLVRSAHLPFVLIKDKDNKARAYMQKGEFLLPDDGEELFGQDHPFCKEVARDLARLTCHIHAGDFVFSGWRPDGKLMTFPAENGSHAGPGKEEVEGFALLPKLVPIEVEKGSYIDTFDLRNATFRFLHPEEEEETSEDISIPFDKGDAFRIMTYNIHSCIGMDEKTSPWRVSRVIAQYDPDIVALQEVDVGKARTQQENQVNRIAKKLRMNYLFFPTMERDGEQYGIALLSRFELKKIKMDLLPGINGWSHLEPRGALWCQIDIGGQYLNIINTHLGLLNPERENQTRELMSQRWLKHEERKGPVLICGDMNAMPGTVAYNFFMEELQDVQTSLGGYQPQRTLAGRFPIARIDHIFMSREFEVRKVIVADDDLAKVASDHLPLIADLKLK